MERQPADKKSKDKSDASVDSFSANSKEHKTSSRQRGIKASRIKLEKALHAAGLKTQAALANIIADKEDLDSPPKDLVNKAFRERPVELQTIQRIADALGVEAYTLYLSSDDIELERTITKKIESNESIPSQLESTLAFSSVNNPQQSLFKKFRYLFLLLITLPVIFGLYLLIKDKKIVSAPADDSRKTHVEINKKSSNQLSTLAIGSSLDELQSSSSDNLVDYSKNIAISVLSLEKNNADALLGQMLPDKLRTLLEKKYRLSSSEFHLLNPEISPWELPKKIGVDFVVQSQVVKKGRYSGLLIYLINSKHKNIAFVDVWPHIPSQENIAKSAQKAVKQIERMIQESTNNRLVTQFPLNSAALTAYLAGTYYQDKALITENLTRAQTEFGRALRIAPDFHKARAALCDNLVRLSITSSDKSLLKDAELECLKIQNAAPELPDFYFAMGQVNRKMGNLLVSKNYYENALKLDPEFIDALLGLAEVHISLAGQKSDPGYFDRAIQFVERAEDISPEFWKVLIIKGRVYFYSGQPEKAIAAIRRSVEIAPNITNLNNLASIQFCTGDFEDAKSNFEKLTALDNAPSVSYYNLGLLNFYLGEYNDSSKNIKYYIDSFLQTELKGNHIFWTGLADSYRYLKKTKLAISAYQTALQKIEVERVKGVNQESLDSYAIYIQLALSEMNDAPMKEKDMEQVKERLHVVQTLSKDPYSKAYIVLSWAMLKEYEKAFPIYRELSKSCQGFVGHPLLTPLKKILLSKSEI